jgi:hypothetical protein
MNRDQGASRLTVAEQGIISFSNSAPLSVRFA